MLEQALATRREAVVAATADELTYRRIPRANDLAQRIASRHEASGSRHRESAWSGDASHGSGHPEARSRTRRSKLMGGYAVAES